jgi:hypothetical protein
MEKGLFVDLDAKTAVEKSSSQFFWHLFILYPLFFKLHPYLVRFLILCLIEREFGLRPDLEPLVRNNQGFSL